MKKILILFLMVSVVSCKTDSKEPKVLKRESFPVELDKVFNAHGGLNNWKKVQTLSFNRGEEVHTSDLISRKIVINHPKYSLGFNGSEIWLDEEYKGAFKGNPNFYYNLYFYFYAMPFVLADEGIIYEKVANLVFKENSFPGYKISYKANVGTSPDDNYIIYYNPKSYKMEWLAYTVTFKTKVPNNNYKLIKYDNWENVNGLILPKEIIWYGKDENGMPTEPSKPSVKFILPLVSQGKLSDTFFEKPKE